MTIEIPALNRKTILPFALSSVLWIGLGAGFCVYFSKTAEESHRALVWLFRLSLISLIDLLAIAKVIYYLFELQRPQEPGKRIFSIIRTSYWGVIKIACVLICGTILVKGSHLPAGIPPVGLVTGISTLVVVPLVGGLSWYFTQKPSEG